MLPNIGDSCLLSSILLEARKDIQGCACPAKRNDWVVSRLDYIQVVLMMVMTFFEEKTAMQCYRPEE